MRTNKIGSSLQMSENHRIVSLMRVIVKFGIFLTNAFHFNTNFPPSPPSVSNMRVLRVHLFLSDGQCVTTKITEVCNIFAGFLVP